jgi:hypothetical protein
METKTEIWKDIKGFEGRYQVSNLGRVRSLDWHGHKGRMLKLKINKMWGYYRLNLAHPDGYIKSVSVHRLVAMAFIPNPDNLPEVNHKDENKLNNVVCFNPDGSIDTERTNLEWCTGLYNLRYGTRTERMNKLVNEPRMRPVNQYDFNGNLLHTYKSITDASKAIGVSTRTMFSICSKSGAHSTHGFIFRYADDKSPWVNYNPDLCRGNEERKRTVEQYDKHGNFIRSYESVNEASRITGISRRWIHGICNPERSYKSAHGYVFKYSDMPK